MSLPIGLGYANFIIIIMKTDLQNVLNWESVLNW